MVRFIVALSVLVALKKALKNAVWLLQPVESYTLFILPHVTVYVKNLSGVSNYLLHDKRKFIEMFSLLFLNRDTCPLNSFVSSMCIIWLPRKRSCRRCGAVDQ